MRLHVFGPLTVGSDNGGCAPSRWHGRPESDRPRSVCGCFLQDVVATVATHLHKGVLPLLQVGFYSDDLAGFFFPDQLLLMWHYIIRLSQVFEMFLSVPSQSSCLLGLKICSEDF